MHVRSHLIAGMVTQTIAIHQTPLKVEMPATPAEQAQGLMGRASLPPEQGMLFVLDHPQRPSFWMKDTTIPLDIGFFSADGVLREIQPLTPLSQTPVYAQRDDILYALEVNRGWFAQHHLPVHSARLSTKSI